MRVEDSSGQEINSTENVSTKMRMKRSWSNTSCFDLKWRFTGSRAMVQDKVKVELHVLGLSIGVWTLYEYQPYEQRSVYNKIKLSIEIKLIKCYL